MAITIQVENLPQTVQSLRRVVLSFSDLESRQRISRTAAPVVVAAIQAASPVSKKVHYRYNTPKLVGNLRAPNGLGRKAASYLPGNLRNSVMDLGERRAKFRRLPVTVIGPLYARSKGRGPFGKGRSVDGYYAHMVYGSALAYRKKVIMGGVAASSAAARKLMIDEAQRLILQRAAEAGF